MDDARAVDRAAADRRHRLPVPTGPTLRGQVGTWASAQGRATKAVEQGGVLVEAHDTITTALLPAVASIRSEKAHLALHVASPPKVVGMAERHACEG